MTLKRSRLARRTPLKRTGNLRRRPKHRVITDAERAARAEWKTPTSGPCRCGCDRWTHHLERHHVITLARIKQEGRWDLLWDLRNSLLLHPDCHAAHTGASRRVKIERVPVAALRFAVELLGEPRAAEELRRLYDCRVALPAEPVRRRVA